MMSFFKKPRLFKKIVQQIKTLEDPRSYDSELEKYPELMTMKDNDGKTLLIHAASVNYPDAMANLIENYHADVTVKDNSGKTVYEYAKEMFDNEMNSINNRYKDSPEDLTRERKKIEDNKLYFLNLIKKAEKRKGIKDVASLQQVSRDIDVPGGPIPFVGKVGSFLSGEDPSSLRTQLTRGKQQGGRKRKTRRNRKSRRRI